MPLPAPTTAPGSVGNLQKLQRHARSARRGQEEAVGLLIALLTESVTAVHDGSSNLTTEVSLRRGRLGCVGLHENRTQRPPPTPPGGGPFAWTADDPRA